MRKILIVLLFFLGVSCTPEQPYTFNDYFSSRLFIDVQTAGVFEDSKTFVDCIPKNGDLRATVEKYNSAVSGGEVDLESFVLENYYLPENTAADFVSDTTKPMMEHIEDLWPVLTKDPNVAIRGSSLIPLGSSYVVPGGRFREVYYWDSYFTMEGLVLSGHGEVAVNMVNNFSSLIDSIGFIPNGNRAYYLGRSQPPFYSLMVDLVSSEDRDLFVSYLPYLVKEYEFWMAGTEMLDSIKAYRRVVKMPDGSVLNRYWDDKSGPRPESFREDAELVHEHGLNSINAYKHLRAGAESGWDYSSRWFRDKTNLQTIHTTDIIPVDLNSLLYFLEMMIAKGYNWSDDLEAADIYIEKAANRKEAIQKFLWDEEKGFYGDYDWKTDELTGVWSLAAAYPLYFRIADKGQASSVVDILLTDFLQDGGFVTTLNETGQQWDYPNGWAPLQWICISALYNYGYVDEGHEAARMWLNRNEEVYRSTGKMMEKYNVVDTGLSAGGGEYPLQDGFGWTNGVAIALDEVLQKEKSVVIEN